MLVLGALVHNRVELLLHHGRNVTELLMQAGLLIIHGMIVQLISKLLRHA